MSSVDLESTIENNAVGKQKVEGIQKSNDPVKNVKKGKITVLANEPTKESNNFEKHVDTKEKSGNVQGSLISTKVPNKKSGTEKLMNNNSSLTTCTRTSRGNNIEFKPNYCFIK